MNLYDDSIPVKDAVVLLMNRTSGDELLANAMQVLLEDRLRLLGITRIAGEVRRAQKVYFATRTDTALVTCKELERRLDVALKE